MPQIVTKNVACPMRFNIIMKISAIELGQPRDGRPMKKAALHALLSTEKVTPVDT